MVAHDSLSACCRAQSTTMINQKFTNLPYEKYPRRLQITFSLHFSQQNVVVACILPSRLYLLWCWGCAAGLRKCHVVSFRKITVAANRRRHVSSGPRLGRSVAIVLCLKTGSHVHCSGNDHSPTECHCKVLTGVTVHVVCQLWWLVQEILFQNYWVGGGAVDLSLVSMFLASQLYSIAKSNALWSFRNLIFEDQIQEKNTDLRKCKFVSPYLRKMLKTMLKIEFWRF